MSLTTLPPDDAETTCDKEPVNRLGFIQPHGYMLVLEGDERRVVQVSANIAEIARCSHQEIIGSPLREVFPQLEACPLPSENQTGRTGAVFVRRIELDTPNGLRSYDLSVHHSDAALLLELELVTGDAGSDKGLDELYPRLNAFVEGLHDASSVENLCVLLAQDIRYIADFNRALVYKFDKDWHGTVVAEDRDESLPSYLDLRFPASDIPAQARELYRHNRLRIIPDAAYNPVPVEPILNPSTGATLDLTQAILRSVAPVHVEYMRNMGTMASMSVSIIVDGRLWGLISCHNREPRLVPVRVRNACDFLTRIFSLRLASMERSAVAEHRLRLGGIQGRLLAYIAEEEIFLDGLLKHPEDVLALVEATGAAVVTSDACQVLGVTPTEAEIRSLYDWLNAERRQDDIYATDELSSEYPPSAAFSTHASGLLAISISQKYSSFVLWFRPEVVQTVKWGGNPTKTVSIDVAGGGARLHPRTSFAMWKETVQGRSLPWSAVEIDAVKDLRSSVLDIVLRRAEELAALSEELQRSNKELEAFSYSVSHDLRAPFRHIVGYSELLSSREGHRLTDKGRHYVDTLREAALSAGTLVDNLLSFSQMGRNALIRIDGDMNALVDEVRRKLMRDVPSERSIRWSMEPLGRVYADPTMLRLAIENLLSNAIKYTGRRPEALIEVGRAPNTERHAVFFVKDNGVGFDMAYSNKLFGVFQRLHRLEEFEGTGIGLANVRRIVERHGGQTWADGTVDQGACFFFTLTLREEPRSNG